MKKENAGLKRLLEFSGSKQKFLTLSKILSGVSALFILMPYICIYGATKELIGVFAGRSLDTQYLIRCGIFAVGFELVGLLIEFIALLCSHTVAFQIEKNLKLAVLTHLSKMPIGYFEKNPSGKLRKIIDENSVQTETFIAHQLPDLVGAQVTMIAGVILMLVFDWRIGLPLLIFFALGFVVQGAFMGKDTMEFMKNYQDYLEAMNHEAVEYVRGISVVKVFGQTVHSITKFKVAIENYRKYAMAFTMACKKGMVAFNTIINASFVALVPAALIASIVSQDLVGFMESFLFYVIFSPACGVMLNKIMYMSNYKMQAEESMRRIDLILHTPKQEDIATSQAVKGYDVQFNQVTFTYEGVESPAIKNICFTAKAGTTTALVGHSGSGKSTIASLIPRFYDIQEGKIEIGEVDIRQISQEDLMEKVSFVFQNPKLFKESLLDNIKAGRQNATREEVLNAAHLAQCDDILEKLPNGIDTVVGQKGVYLSGGEVQRIAIARALLKNAPIIVLDEATAYADPENEQQIQEALKYLTKEKTVIMIAHRLSTVQEAEQILVMKQGEMIEEGTHLELLNQQGEYAKMWKEYSKTVQWHIGSGVKVC